MIELELTKQQETVKHFIHEMCKAAVRPHTVEWERNHRIPDDFMLRLVQMQAGMRMGEVPKEFGGEGGGVGETKDRKGKEQRNRFAILGAEEIAWGDVGVLMNMPGPGLGGPPVAIMGTPEQKKKYMSVFAQPGLHYGAYGLTEPTAGSDVAGIRTTCRKDGHHWVINGRKCFITNGGRADWVVIFATTDRTLGRAGHRAFVVEKGTPGFSLGKIEQKMGLRSSETAELVLEDVRVHEDCLLGGEALYKKNEGFMGAMKTFDSSRPMVASLAVGIARAAYEYARDFVKENYLLARPIPRYAAIAATLADDARLVDASRLMCWRAASMADEGIPNAKEASMCKAYAARAAMKVCADAVQILGAHGLEQHQLVEKWYRDIKVFDIFEGTGQIQRIVISKRILREQPSF